LGGEVLRAPWVLRALSVLTALRAVLFVPIGDCVRDDELAEPVLEVGGTGVFFSQIELYHSLSNKTTIIAVLSGVKPVDIM
jgi:hypothetical protein